MTKKRAIAVGVAVVLGCALWWWASRDEGTASTAADKKQPAAEREPNPRLRKRIDVKTLPKAQISGKVVDEDGKAVAGARVCGTSWSRQLSPQDTWRPTCTNAGANGEYRMTELLPADWRVVADHPGFIPGRYEKELEDGDTETRVELEAGQNATGIDIVLRKGGVEVHGVVRDIGGGPVAGAWVTVSGRGAGRAGESIVTTTAAGEFTARTTKGRISVQASADGYSNGWSQGLAPGQFIEVLLTPESVLAGKVIDGETRQPVARARVSANGGSYYGRGERGEALTDENGEFRINGLESGRYKPSAEIAGAYGKARESTLLGLGQTVDGVVIELHPAFIVTGTIVVADESNTPCKEGWVTLVNPETERRFHGSVEHDDGRVEVEAVLPGTYKVSVQCSNYMAEEEYADLTVVEDMLDQEWTVRTGGVIRGIVKDADGKPVPEASVRARLAGGQMSSSSWNWDESDEEGRFEMKGVTAGTWRLEADIDGLPSPEDPTEVELEEGGTADVELSLLAGGTIAGSVVDEKGEPMKAAGVRARGKTWGSWGARTQTRDDGSFEIEGVRPGEYRVLAARGGYWGPRMRKPGSTDDDLQGEETVVRVGETSTVRLVVESQEGEIRGRVLDESGTAVTDAFVAAERQSERAGASARGARRSVRRGWQRKPSLTDMDGSFVVEDLAPGTYVVRAYRRGGGEAIAEGVGLGSDVTLTIEAVGSMAGRLEIEGIDPPGEFTIAITDRENGFWRSEHFFRTGGQWVMRDLPGGTYTVSVESGLGTAKIEDVSLSEGQARTGVVLELEPRATVTGRVIALDTGEPLKGYRIHVRALKGSGSTPWLWGVEEKGTVTDENGRFEVSGAPSGRVWVSGWNSDWEGTEHGQARKLATLEPGETQDVGDLKAARRRTERRERSGDLGFTTEDTPPNTEPEDEIIKVAYIRPDGPAADSGLEVGDVIVSVEGNDVRGVNEYLYGTLTSVAEGEKVVLGLARDESVTITAGPPK